MEAAAGLASEQAGGDHLLERLRRGVGTLADSIRNPESRASVLDIVQTPGQRAVLDRLTALMTLLEGHAEFVMDGVGPEVIPTVEQIRAGFNRRREAGNPLEKAIRRLLGVDVEGLGTTTLVVSVGRTSTSHPRRQSPADRG